jgi:hypothetical protein
MTFGDYVRQEENSKEEEWLNLQNGFEILDTLITNLYK